jgi:hypothetical protein
MKKLDLGQTIQILANFGVIAGIVFLTIEIDQNSEALESEARYNQLMIENELYDTLSFDDVYVEKLLRAMDGKELTPVEQFQLIASFQKTYQTLEWIYIELPDRRPRIERRRQLLDIPIGRQAWEQQKEILESEFVEFMEEGTAIMLIRFWPLERNSTFQRKAECPEI